MYTIHKNDVSGTLSVTIATRFNDKPKGSKNTPCKDLFNALIHLLDDKGFDTSNKNDTRAAYERPLSLDYRYGKFKDLEVEVEMSKDSIRFKFYQNINTGGRPKGDGRYCHRQVSLMPVEVHQGYENICALITCKVAAVLQQNPIFNKLN